jgi:hypothetical protein
MNSTPNLQGRMNRLSAIQSRRPDTGGDLSASWRGRASFGTALAA